MAVVTDIDSRKRPLVNLFIFLLDKLVVGIRLQLKPESFSTKSYPRTHERVTAQSLSRSLV